MVGVLVAIGVLAFVVFIVAIANIRIVPQAHAVVIERLGRYQATWATGIHVKIPFIDKIAKKISLMEQISDFPPQPVITRDNVKMQIDTIVFYQVTDCKLFSYGVANPVMAIENLSATTLRNIIGDMELDETLTSRDIINTKMRSILDEATDPWGIKVNRVELKNIIPPREIQEAMEKQMKAERERREKILQAEGDKNSAILRAEGDKQARILSAEADKQEAILRAEASKEAQMREAEGQAQAILEVQRATAEGIRLINASNPSQAVLTIKGYEALVGVANGNATKLIIPSDMSGVISLANAVKETISDKSSKSKGMTI